HLPVAEWNWDAGEMNFSVGEGVDLSGFEEGQKVQFLVEKQGSDYVLKQLVPATIAVEG
ncbi:copper-binding protein, partial [Vibrio alginolyticus]